MAADFGSGFHGVRGLLVSRVGVAHEDCFDVVHLREFDGKLVHRSLSMDVHCHFDQALSGRGKGALMVISAATRSRDHRSQNQTRSRAAGGL